MRLVKKALKTTATIFSILAGIGATLFVRGVLYRFSIPASTKLQQVGMWAFGLAISLAVQQKLHAIFHLEADSIVEQIESATENPWKTN